MTRNKLKIQMQNLVIEPWYIIKWASVQRDVHVICTMLTLCDQTYTFNVIVNIMIITIVIMINIKVMIFRCRTLWVQSVTTTTTTDQPDSWPPPLSGHDHDENHTYDRDHHSDHHHDEYDHNDGLKSVSLCRNILGTRNLSEILAEREDIGDHMHKVFLVLTFRFKSFYKRLLEKREYIGDHMHKVFFILKLSRINH